MNISRAKYFCYRNLKEVNIEFTGGVNVLWGLNGQGKSNILEGIYYFARGRSFRGAKDRDLIMFGEQEHLLQASKRRFRFREEKN